MVLFLFHSWKTLYIIARWDEGKEERARRTLQNNIIFEIMNEIKIFNNNNFGKLRVIVKEGKVWFCLADACKALEIMNPRNVKKRLDSRGVHTMDVSTNSKNQHGEFTRTQIMSFIDEKCWLPARALRRIGRLRNHHQYYSLFLQCIIEVIHSACL